MVEYATVGALAFQAFHLFEHVAQLVYWLIHPTQAPWLTPWAESGRDLLVVDGTAASGSELLHLLGNLIFMAGIAGMWWLVRDRGFGIDHVHHLGGAAALQGLHVLEHLALTGSYLIAGKAMGATTLLGAATGSFGSGLRVWAHFLLNLGASWYAYRAATSLWRRSIPERSTGRSARDAPLPRKTA